MRLKQTNFELIGAAKDKLSNNWGIAIGGTLILMVIYMVSSFIPGVTLIITGPMSLGFAVFSLTIARDYQPNIEQVFSGFNRFGRALGTYLLSLLVILVGLIPAMAVIIWIAFKFVAVIDDIDQSEILQYFTATNIILSYVVIFLLMLPGIILAFGLSQVYFILADDNQIGIEAALRKSWEMMKGYKMKYFGLMMIFAILSILSVFTLFIGLLFIVPLYFVSTAKFYEEIRGDIAEEDTLEKNLID